MGKERATVTSAIEGAVAGKKVSLVSSGDAGIYGIGGLVLELRRARGIRLVTGEPDGLEVGVIPGMPAICAAASLLSASISLSDLLTPISVIMERVEAPARADFIIVLCNPRSRNRVAQLQDVLGVILKYRGPGTPVGIVKKGMREGRGDRTRAAKKGVGLLHVGDSSAQEPLN